MELDTYILGIIYGVSSVAEGRLVFRHKDKYFIRKLQSVFGGTIYTQLSNTDVQYVLKIRNDKLIEYLNSLGYMSRNNEIRLVPQIADSQFLQAYLELHSSIDWQVAYKRSGNKYHKTRLRIYGNKYFIDGINFLLRDCFDCTLKTPQKVTDKTYYLSMTKKEEIQKLYDVYSDEEEKCIEFWNKYKEYLGGN